MIIFNYVVVSLANKAFHMISILFLFPLVSYKNLLTLMDI